MERAIEILKQYKQADSNERMSLFLQFIDLRNHFIDIELKNPAVEKSHSILDGLKFIGGNNYNLCKRYWSDHYQKYN